jgi:hypothetical protein
MRLANRWNWPAVLAVVVGLLVIGNGFFGCSQSVKQADAASTDTKKAESSKSAPDDPKPAESKAIVAKPPAKDAVKKVSGQPSAADIPAADIPAADIPAADIVAGVDYYIKRVGNSLSDESEYEDKQDRISKDANTLAVLALALGLHDGDSKYKAAAPAMIKAARELAATKDHAAAKKAAAALNAAAKGKNPLAAKLKWKKVSSFKEVKAQLSTVESSLKRYAKRKKKTDECAKFSAVIAVFGQAIICHGDETEKPDELEQWTKYCVEMRDAAAAVNSAVHAKDEKATKAAMANLAQSCETCHEVFKTDE